MITTNSTRWEIFGRITDWSAWLAEEDESHKHFGEQGTIEQDPLDSIVGIGRGNGEAVGREHNRYLYGQDEQ